SPFMLKQFPPRPHFSGAGRWAPDHGDSLKKERKINREGKQSEQADADPAPPASHRSAVHANLRRSSVRYEDLNTRLSEMKTGSKKLLANCARVDRVALVGVPLSPARVLGLPYGLEIALPGGDALAAILPGHAFVIGIARPARIGPNDQRGQRRQP